MDLSLKKRKDRAPEDARSLMLFDKDLLLVLDRSLLGYVLSAPIGYSK